MTNREEAELAITDLRVNGPHPPTDMLLAHILRYASRILDLLEEEREQRRIHDGQ